MRRRSLILCFVIFAHSGITQPYTHFFSPDSLKTIVSFLASDSLKGRGNFTPELETAASFISDQFKTAGHLNFADLPAYLSPFVVQDNTTSSPTLLLIDNKPVKSEDYVFVSPFYIPATVLYRDFRVVYAREKEGNERISFINDNVSGTSQPVLVVLLPPGRQPQISELQKQLNKLQMPEHSLLIISHDKDVSDLKISLHPSVRKRMLFNLMGLLPGKSLANEIVIFSAHYDHVGTTGVGQEQVIFNGANDNASGTAAMLSLMKYFATKNDNERTLLFVAFAGEELGLKGSFFLSEQYDWKNVKAMLNFEMLGKPDGHGLKKIIVTNFHSSGLPRSMRQHCTDVKLIADNHSAEKLDQRSDHFPFLLKKIPAHTFMCFSSSDKTYHKPGDDTSTLNFQNFSDLLNGMLPAIGRVVSGANTPHN